MTTKNCISKNISNNINIPINESKMIVDTFLKTIIFNSKHKKVKISGFGAFSIKNSPKRVGRNPKTRESYIIDTMKKLNFSPSNKIKNYLNLWKNY